MPILYNPQTQEPYLRLPAPLSHIILTPHRLHQLEETIAVKVPLLNDPRIYLNLTGPPYPYLREHEEEWVKSKCAAAEPVLQALRAEFQTSVLQQQYFDLCPFTVIREVTEEDPQTGHPKQDVLIGDIEIARYMFYEYRHDSPERAEAQRLNNELPPGDEGIAWGIGCEYTGYSICIRLFVLCWTLFTNDTLVFRLPGTVPPRPRNHDSGPADADPGLGSPADEHQAAHGVGVCRECWESSRLREKWFRGALHLGRLGALPGEQRRGVEVAYRCSVAGFLRNCQRVLFVSVVYCLERASSLLIGDD